MNKVTVNADAVDQVLVQYKGKTYELDTAQLVGRGFLRQYAEPITGIKIGDLFVRTDGGTRPVVIAGKIPAPSNREERTVFLLGTLGYEQYSDVAAPMTPTEVIDWLNARKMTKVGNVQLAATAMVAQALKDTQVSKA